jgi:biotin carboxyl carrier protein
VVLEAMKMEHSVRTPHEGTLAQLNVSAGQTVDMGTVLAVVEDAAGGPADSTSDRDGARD